MLECANPARIQLRESVEFPGKLTQGKRGELGLGKAGMVKLTHDLLIDVIKHGLLSTIYGLRYVHTKSSRANRHLLPVAMPVCFGEQFAFSHKTQLDIS